MDISVLTDERTYCKHAARRYVAVCVTVAESQVLTSAGGGLASGLGVVVGVSWGGDGPVFTSGLAGADEPQPIFKEGGARR